MALNGLICAEVPLRIYSLTHSNWTTPAKHECRHKEQFRAALSQDVGLIAQCLRLDFSPLCVSLSDGAQRSGS